VGDEAGGAGVGDGVEGDSAMMVFVSPLFQGLLESRFSTSTLPGARARRKLPFPAGAPPKSSMIGSLVSKRLNASILS
jgi:hypothetical protein